FRSWLRSPTRRGSVRGFLWPWSLFPVRAGRPWIKEVKGRDGGSWSARGSAREDLLEEGVELCEMLGHQSRRRGGRGRPAGIARLLRLEARALQDPAQVGLHEGPGPHVLGFLLAPHEVGVLEAREFGEDGLHGEGIELLQV